MFMFIITTSTDDGLKIVTLFFSCSLFHAARQLLRLWKFSRHRSSVDHLANICMHKIHYELIATCGLDNDWAMMVLSSRAQQAALYTFHCMNKCLLADAIVCVCMSYMFAHWPRARQTPILTKCQHVYWCGNQTLVCLTCVHCTSYHLK